MAQVAREDEERARKEEEQRSIQTALSKVTEAETKIRKMKEAEAGQTGGSGGKGGGGGGTGKGKRRGKRNKAAKAEESDDGAESDSYGETDSEYEDEAPPPRQRQRRRQQQHHNHHRQSVAAPVPPPLRRQNAMTSSVKARRGGETDYLQWGKAMGPLMSEGKGKGLYGVMGKRYKRALQTGLKNMVSDGGALKTLLTDEEKALLAANKGAVDRIIQDNDFNVNPFEDDLAPIGKTVLGVLQEVQRGDGVA